MEAGVIAIPAAMLSGLASGVIQPAVGAVGSPETRIDAAANYVLAEFDAAGASWQK
jgi:hypothetical protein